MGSNPTQAQCKFLTEELLGSQMGLSGGNVSISPNQLIQISLADFCLPRDLVVGPTGTSHFAIQRY